MIRNINRAALIWIFFFLLPLWIFWPWSFIFKGPLSIFLLRLILIFCFLCLFWFVACVYFTWLMIRIDALQKLPELFLICAFLRWPLRLNKALERFVHSLILEQTFIVRIKVAHFLSKPFTFILLLDLGCPWNVYGRTTWLIIVVLANSVGVSQSAFYSFCRPIRSHLIMEDWKSVWIYIIAYDITKKNIPLILKIIANIYSHKRLFFRLIKSIFSTKSWNSIVVLPVKAFLFHWLRVIVVTRTDKMAWSSPFSFGFRFKYWGFKICSHLFFIAIIFFIFITLFSFYYPLTIPI